MLYDWNVDGHYIMAETAEAAYSVAARLYDFTPERVRPWTEEDQALLDWQIEN